MIPQVSMQWTHKVTECKFCEKDIETATPVVSVFFKHKDKSWNARYGYHPACWIQNGLDYLKANPYITVPEKIELSDNDKIIRDKLIRKHASLKQRLVKLDKSSPKYYILVAKIEAQIAQLIVDILPLGGVPKKWSSNE